MTLSQCIIVLWTGLLVVSSFVRWPSVVAFTTSPHREAIRMHGPTRLSRSSMAEAMMGKTRLFLSSNPLDNDGVESEADRLKRQANELREQIRRMEEQLGGDSRTSRRNNNDEYITSSDDSSTQQPQDPTQRTLHNKRILVTGANGRLGSMVCRYLLRNYPTTQVVAAVHVVGENSPTSRGYGRLSYEVGAEDGIGSIGAAWSNADERIASFQFDPTTMAGYNLQNLRVVECELLDPIQCQSVVEGCDAVIWCATDFNGNQPRAVSSLNVALLFRAVSRPDKGRVEVEGVLNMLGALKLAQQDQKRQQQQQFIKPSSRGRDPINFVLVSTAPEAWEDFETPFGSFWDIKQQGERMTLQDFPSLSTTVLQLSRFEDNFVPEDLDIRMEVESSTTTATVASTSSSAAASSSSTSSLQRKARRKINRRDAAKAVVDALVNDDLVGKTVQLWTAE